jgi:activating signal cointegrator 1
VKALTLTEPWASLVACGAKYYETRSWRTAYLGALAIHAAKGFPAWARDLANCQRVRQLVGISYVYPVGCVVATCRLADCVPVESLLALSAQEEMFGNYERGRFAWVLTDVRPLTEPMPAKGSLGLWEWEQSKATPV